MEARIEVKSTKEKIQDGFDITPNESVASHVSGIVYKIYRIYDLDIKKEPQNYVFTKSM